MQPHGVPVLSPGKCRRLTSKVKYMFNKLKCSNCGCGIDSNSSDAGRAIHCPNCGIAAFKKLGVTLCGDRETKCRNKHILSWVMFIIGMCVLPITKCSLDKAYKNNGKGVVPATERK